MSMFTVEIKLNVDMKEMDKNLGHFIMHQKLLMTEQKIH